MSIERNPWAKEFWNLTAQGRFLQKHGLEAARAAATEAGLDPDKQPGLKEQKLTPTGLDPDLLGAFSKENAEKFQQKAATYKPPAPPKGGLDYSGYMRKKRAGKLPRQG
jgi:hypothetical protein